MSTTAEPAAAATPPAAPTSTPAAAPEAPTQQTSGRFGPSPGAAVAEFDPVHPRILTESTRSLFARMGQSAAATAEAAAKAAPTPVAAPDDPYDHDDEPAPAPAPAAAATAPAVAPDPAPAATPAPAVSTPTPAPADHRAALAVAAREKAIADREAAFAAREKALEDSRKAIADEAIADYEAQQAAKYLEGGTEALTDFIKKWTGITDAEVPEEWQGIIGEGSGRYLKLQVEPEVAGKLSQRRTIHKVTAGQLASKREVERLRAAVAARDAAEEARRQAEAKQAEEARAAEKAKAEEAQMHAGIVAILKTADSTGKPYAQRFPNLTSEPDPAAWVIEAAKQLGAHSDKPFTWEEAAGMAETHLKQTNEAFFNQRRHLFTQTAPAPQPAATPAAVPQGAPQGRGARTTTTLTNGAAPAAPATAPKPAPAEPAEPAAFDMEAERRKNFARLREAMAKREQATA